MPRLSDEIHIQIFQNHTILFGYSERIGTTLRLILAAVGLAKILQRGYSKHFSRSMSGGLPVDCFICVDWHHSLRPPTKPQRLVIRLRRRCFNDEHV